MLPTESDDDWIQGKTACGKPVGGYFIQYLASSIQDLGSIQPDHSTAEAFVSVVEDRKLTRSDAWIFFVDEFNHQRAVRRGVNPAGGEVLAVADPNLEVVPKWGLGHPVGTGDGETFAGVPRKHITMSCDHDVACDVLGDHIPGPAGEAQTLALSNGVEPRSPVFTQNPVGVDLTDFAWSFSQMVAHKFVERNPTEETDTLAVGAVSVGEPETSSLGSNLVLGELSDRE